MWTRTNKGIIFIPQEKTKQGLYITKTKLNKKYKSYEDIRFTQDCGGDEFPNRARGYFK